MSYVCKIRGVIYIYTSKYDTCKNKKDLLAISLTRVVFVKEYLVIRL